MPGSDLGPREKGKCSGTGPWTQGRQPLKAHAALAVDGFFQKLKQLFRKKDTENTPSMW